MGFVKNALTAIETIKDKHYDIWKNAIGAKKINATDVSHVFIEMIGLLVEFVHVQANKHQSIYI